MKKVNHYTDDFKIKVVQEVLSGKITKEECRSRYGIGGNSTVLRWIRTFTGKPTNFPKVSHKEKSDEVIRLREQLELLKKELEYEKLKSSSYLEMIKIAEEDLKIPIRKKPGAKRSKK